jgi:hypothetical protein
LVFKPGFEAGITRKPRAADDYVNMDPQRLLVQYGEAEVPIISVLNPTIELPAMMRIWDVFFSIPDPGSKTFRIPDPDLHQRIQVFLT